MPRKGFGVFGGDPAQHARANLMPVSEELDVAKQHDFYFGAHPHFWNMFECDNQDQVDTITETSLALMSIVAGREIPFQQGFHNHRQDCVCDLTFVFIRRLVATQNHSALLCVVGTNGYGHA